MSFRYIAEALFLLGIAVWLIRWIGRTMRELGNSGRAQHDSRTPLAKLFEETGAARYIAERGGLSPAQVASLSEREREVLMQETALRLSGARAVAQGETPALPSAGRGPGAAVAVHCPACGTLLTETPVPLPFAAACPGCRRRVNVRGDGAGRISVVVTDARD